MLGNVFRSLQIKKQSVPNKGPAPQNAVSKGWGATTSGPDNNYVLTACFFNEIPPPDSYGAIGVKIPCAKKIKNTHKDTQTHHLLIEGGQLKKNRFDENPEMT